MNAEQKRKIKHAYYLAHKAKWATVYLRNRRRVLAAEKKPAQPRRTYWSAEDDKVLRRLYPHHDCEWVAGQLGRTASAVYRRAHNVGAEKTPAYLAALIARVNAKLTEVGKAHRFQKGHISANKGLRRPGWSAGRMQETQFRKGMRSGKAAAHYKPLGSGRLVEGYLYVKVAEVPNVAYTVNWKLVHVLNWERANGRPVPPGHVLRFRDANKCNVGLDNLELLTFRQNMLRNSVHNLPKELARVVQLRGALVRQINKRSGNEKRN